MIKQSGFICVLVGAVVSGCVTTHYGETNSLGEGKIHASCSNPESLTSEFASVSCTFENMTDQWVDVEAVQAGFKDDGKVISPLTPEQTLAFMKAYRYKKTKDDTNFNLAVGSLALAGVAVAAASGNSSVARTGAAVGLGALATSAGGQVIDEVHDAQYPRYGEAHMLGPATNIPAKLFVRRTIIFQSTPRRLSRGQLEICMKLPNIECFSPVLNNYRTRSI